MTLKEKLKKRCYEEHKNKDGICYGLVGGDCHTDYLQYACIGCPYYTYYKEDSEK